MIDRHILRYFLAVVDHGSFTRAAASCNVSQSALSIGIAKLERETGERLFRRNSRRVDLTAAGGRFLAYARDIEQAFLRAEGALGPAGPTKLLRVGMLSTLPVDLVSRFVTDFMAQSDRQIELVEGRAHELRERLSTARIDLALTLDPGNDRNPFEPVFSEGYGMAMPQAHPLSSMAEIDGQMLADSVMIVRRHCEVLSQTSRYFTQRGVRPFFAARTMSDSRALSYVGAGLGVTVMPDCFQAEGVSRARLVDFDLIRTIGIEARERSEMFTLCHRLAANVFESGRRWIDSQDGRD